MLAVFACMVVLVVGQGGWHNQSGTGFGLGLGGMGRAGVGMACKLASGGRGIAQCMFA